MKRIVLGNQSIVIRYPMISSITILGSSFLPQHLSASPEIQLAKKKKVRIVSSYRGKGIEERTRKIGMATRVPAVPGAVGTYPAPKVDANSRTKRFIFSGFKGSGVQEGKFSWGISFNLAPSNPRPLGPYCLQPNRDSFLL